MAKDNLNDLISKNRSAVMGIASFWIFAFHLWMGLVHVEVFRFLRHVGFVGVDFFFMLSGMGLMYSIEKNGTWGFYARRLSRVFLPFAVIAVLYKIIQDWSWVDFLKNLLCISFYTEHITSFFWYVPAILTLYLFYPLYCRWFRRAKSKGVFTLTAIFTWLVLSLLAANIPPVRSYFDRTWMYLFTNRIPIFLTGIYLGWRLREKPVMFSWWHFCICIFVFYIGMRLMRPTYYNGEAFLIVPESYSFLPAYFMTVSGVPLTVKTVQLLSKYCGKVGDTLTGMLSVLGGLSLEFYLAHPDIGAMIKDRLEYHAPDLLVDLLMLVCSLLAAFALDAVCRCLRKVCAQLWKRRTATVSAK